METITLHPFQAGYESAFIDLIKAVGWNERQIQGQITALHELARNVLGYVLIAKRNATLLGYVSAQFYDWNSLGQIHSTLR